MGKTKLRIQRLESAKARQEKFSKRKVGLLKKAKELAILCDVDLAVVMFSPSGKPSLCVGQDKDLSTVLKKLSTLSFHLREERRAETIKKKYPTEELAVDPRNFSSTEGDDIIIKLQKEQLLELEEKLARKRKILRDWQDPQKVNNLAQIKLMEAHLAAILSRMKKEKVAKDLQTY